MRPDPRIYRDNGEGLIDSFEGEEGRIGVLCQRHPQVSGESEDAAAVIPIENGGWVLAVADGVGGARGGEIASHLALEQMARVVGSEELPLRERVMQGFEEANTAILDLGVGAATTLAVVTVEGGIVRSYHAGDSEMWLVGSRGRVKYRTVSHSPVGYAVASGVLDGDSAIFHEERHVISNHVGNREMRIDVSPPLPLASQDTVLLGTDGLFDNLKEAEIVQRIRKGPLRLAMNELSVLCTARMAAAHEGQPSKEDDLTLILYRGPRRTRARGPGGTSG